MFVLDRTSTCTVCWEPFSFGDKGPCAIPCGHVFCVDCITKLERSNCPLCREHFEPELKVKLFLGDYTDTPVGLEADQNEARRLQEAITDVANKGTSEDCLRQLIAECKEFLSERPRELYPDFRSSYKMLAYLCEVKVTLRSRDAAVDSLTEQVSKLKREKAELKVKIKGLESARRDERKAALAMEQDLKEHCAKAHTAYQTMVSCYNTLVKECAQLREDVQRISFLPASFHESPLSTSLESRVSPAAFSTKLSQIDLKGAAITDPNSFLISPLTEFSGELPSTLENFAALPDVEEDIYPRPPVQRSSPSLPTQDTCTAIGHPYSCQCAPHSLFPDALESHSLLSSPEEPANRNASLVEVDHSTTLPIPIPRSQQYVTPSAPKAFDSGNNGRSRSHSKSSQHSNKKNSQSLSLIPSQPPSPGLKNESGRSRKHGSPDQRHATSRAAVSSSLPVPQDPETLRNRLHELLQDTSSVSGSLPVTSSNRFSPSLDREAAHGSGRVPSHPSSPSSSPVRHQHSPQVALNECQPAPPPPQAPRVSTASAAAQAFASQKEKQRALEKEQERERKRKEKAERERLRAEAKAQHGLSPAGATASVSRNATSTFQTLLPQGSYSSTNVLSGPPTLTRRDSTQNRPGSTMPATGAYQIYHQPHQQQRHDGRKGPSASATMTSRPYA